MAIETHQEKYDKHKKEMKTYITNSILENGVDKKHFLNKIKILKKLEFCLDSDNLFMILMILFFIFIACIKTYPISVLLFTFLTLLSHMTIFLYFNKYEEELKKEIVKQALSYIELHPKEEMKIFVQELMNYKDKEKKSYFEEKSPCFKEIENSILAFEKNKKLKDKKLEQSLTFEEEITLLKKYHNVKK